jgi:RNA polymerase sigma factor (sigma-70 family)
MGFDATYRELYPRVLSYARLVAAPADVEDVVADTFMAAWRRRNAMPAGEELGWLIGIARGVIANRRRGQRRLDALRARLALERPPVAIDSFAPASDGALSLALQTLAPSERETLLLVNWLGLTTADAARALGISAPAVRMRLARARRKLKLELEPQTNEGCAAWNPL